MAGEDKRGPEMRALSLRVLGTVVRPDSLRPAQPLLPPSMATQADSNCVPAPLALMALAALRALAQSSVATLRSQ